MSSNPGLIRGLLLQLIVWGSLPLTIFGQDAPRIAPVPRDPLELAASQTQPAETPASREAALQLLARARRSFALRSAGQGYDLKVSFTVDSQRKTNYDGAWEMEDLFAPERDTVGPLQPRPDTPSPASRQPARSTRTGPRARCPCACSKRAAFCSTRFSLQPTRIAGRFGRLQPPFMA